MARLFRDDLLSSRRYGNLFANSRIFCGTSIMYRLTQRARVRESVYTRTRRHWARPHIYDSRDFSPKETHGAFDVRRARRCGGQILSSSSPQGPETLRDWKALSSLTNLFVCAALAPTGIIQFPRAHFRQPRNIPKQITPFVKRSLSSRAQITR